MYAWNLVLMTTKVKVHCVVIVDSRYHRSHKFEKYKEVPATPHFQSSSLEMGHKATEFVQTRNCHQIMRVEQLVHA